MQPSEQSPDQPPRRRRGPGRPWPKGVSGNPLGKHLQAERRAALRQAIDADLGNDLPLLDRALADRAIDLLCRRPANHGAAERASATAARIIAGLRNRAAKRQQAEPEPSGVTLDEIRRRLTNGERV